MSSLASEGFFIEVLSATILETTKTSNGSSLQDPRRAHTLRSKV